MKNQTYRAFTVRPSQILDLNGELLDSARILYQLASEVHGISAYATYVVRNDVTLGERLVSDWCGSGLFSLLLLVVVLV